MSRPSVQAIGQAVATTAKVISSAATVLNSLCNAADNLSGSAVHISKAYATEIETKCKVESADMIQRVLEDCSYAQAQRKHELAQKLSDNEDLNELYDEAYKNLEAALKAKN